MQSTLRAIVTAAFAAFWVATIVPVPPIPWRVSRSHLPILLRTKTTGAAAPSGRADYQDNSLWQASKWAERRIWNTKANHGS